MQGGIPVNPVARAASHFSALYPMLLLIPTAINLFLHASFTTPRNIYSGVNGNLIYAALLSSLGLVLMYSEASLTRYVHEDWRANLMARLEAIVLGFTVILYVAHHIAPSSFLIVAFATSVSIVGIEMIARGNGMDELGFGGTLVLVLGYS